MESWRSLVEKLQSGEQIGSASTSQQLNNMLDEWSQLRERTHATGPIQEKAQERIKLLNKYAGYRMENVRYLIRYLETGDDAQMRNISDNTRHIKRVLESLNGPAKH